MRTKQPKSPFWSYTTHVYDLSFGQVRIERVGDGPGTVYGLKGVLHIKDIERMVADLNIILENELRG